MDNTRLIIPGFWLNETGGKLQPAIIRYLKGDSLSREDIGLIRAYLRQWMAGFPGPENAALAKQIDGLDGRERIQDWLDLALEMGIDPL